MQTGKELRTLEGNSDGVTSVAISPDGKYVISGSEDGSIKFWSLKTCEEIGTLIQFDTGDWIFFTQDNRFDCSPNATQFCGWVSGLKYYPLEQYEKQYRVPGLAKKLLAPEK